MYTEAFGEGAYITKCTVQLMRDLGSIPSPFNAFLLNLGLETLHLRVPRHCENAQKVAEFLEKQPDVAWINYSGLPGNPYHELAQRQFDGGRSCGVVTFGIKGGRERAIKFIDSLKLTAIVTHVADARTCVLHRQATRTDSSPTSSSSKPACARISSASPWALRTPTTSSPTSARPSPPSPRAKSGFPYLKPCEPDPPADRKSPCARGAGGFFGERGRRDSSASSGTRAQAPRGRGGNGDTRGSSSRELKMSSSSL